MKMVCARAGERTRAPARIELLSLRQLMLALFAGLGLMLGGIEAVGFAAPVEAARRPRVSAVAFSHPHGFYDAPLELMLSSTTTGSSIRFTTDGSEPSSTHGTVFSTPIRIAKTTPLRAVAFKAGLEPGPITTQSYLFLSDILKQTGAGLPTAWGADWQMDPRVVNDARYAPRIRDDMKSLPVLCISIDPPAFWGPQGIYTQSQRHGVEVERACSAEMFFPDHSREGFEIYCGLRVAGGASRYQAYTPKHGLRLLFKTQYGASKLRYRFFDDTEVDEFDSIALRPNFNMSWVRTDNTGPLNNRNSDGAERTHAILVRDQFVKESFHALGQIGAHERFVQLYINGVYWGLYNPSERTDASFAASYWGGKKEEYDAITSDLSAVSHPVDGDKATWNQMFALAGRGLGTPAAYAEIQHFLEVTNLADYMLLNFYCSTVDWPWQNWNALRQREEGGQFHFVVWDAEYALETPPWVPADRTSVGKAPSEMDSPARLYDLLKQNEEWRLLFADRAQLHLFGNGALTSQRSAARFVELCDQIDRAIVGESARWGDVVRKNKPYTRDVEWLAEKERLLTKFFPNRSEIVIEQFKRAGLYPRTAAPVFRQQGGRFTNAVDVMLATKTGRIYFTTDGSDPRQPGGVADHRARQYDGPISLRNSARIRARVLDGKEWSALEEALFVEANSLPLYVTEIMSEPSTPLAGSAHNAKDFEFLEIVNAGHTPCDATGVRISGGIRFTFPSRILAPGERIVVVSDRAAFVSRYGDGHNVVGEFSGNLSGAGERLRLEGPLGELIQEFRYPHLVPNAKGHSLVPLAPGAASSWLPSKQIDGSPGL